MNASRNILFTQLKNFAVDVENDVAKLKKSVSNHKSTDVYIETANEQEFLENMGKGIENMSNKLQLMEGKMFGSAASRLSYVTIDEYNEKSKMLYSCNEKLIAALRQKLAFPSKSDNQDLNATTAVDIAYEIDQENCPPQDYMTTNQQCPVPPSGDRVMLGEIDLNMGNVDDNSYFEVEYDMKSRRPSTSMSPLYTSPVHSPKQFTFHDMEAKTPTLADWKLSDATRALVGRTHHDPVQNLMNSSYDMSSERSGNHTPISPDSDLNLSMTTQMITNMNLDDITQTPRTGEKLTFGPHSLLLSPDTPGELTPFRTCMLKDRIEHLERSHRRLLSPDARTSPVPSYDDIYSSDDVIFESNDKMDYMDKSSNDPESYALHMDDLSDNDQSIDISPLKISKLLKPRSAAMEGTIPIIQASEWTSAPGFLQKQVTIDMLNTAVSCLNRYIDSYDNVEIVSQTDMSEILSSFASELQIKTVVMAIVYLKRLDISTDDGIKQYKVKRFY